MVGESNPNQPNGMAPGVAQLFGGPPMGQQAPPPGSFLPPGPSGPMPMQGAPGMFMPGTSLMGMLGGHPGGAPPPPASAVSNLQQLEAQLGVAPPPGSIPAPTLARDPADGGSSATETREGFLSPEKVVNKAHPPAAASPGVPGSSPPPALSNIKPKMMIPAKAGIRLAAMKSPVVLKRKDESSSTSTPASAPQLALTEATPSPAANRGAEVAKPTSDIDDNSQSSEPTRQLDLGDAPPVSGHSESSKKEDAKSVEEENSAPADMQMKLSTPAVIRADSKCATIKKGFHSSCQRTTMAPVAMYNREPEYFTGRIFQGVGDFMVYNLRGGRMRLISLLAKQVGSTVLTGHTAWVVDMTTPRPCSDSNTVYEFVTVSLDGTLIWWKASGQGKNVSGAAECRVQLQPGRHFSRVCWHPSEHRKLFVGASDGEVELIDFDELAAVASPGPDNAMTVSVDANRNTPGILSLPGPTEDAVNCLNVSSDGLYTVVCAGANVRVYDWRIRTLVCDFQPTNSTDTVYQASFCGPNDAYLLIGTGSSYQTRFELWHAPAVRGKRNPLFSPAAGAIHALQFEEEETTDDMPFWWNQSSYCDEHSVLCIVDGRSELGFFVTLAFDGTDGLPRFDHVMLSKLDRPQLFCLAFKRSPTTLVVNCVDTKAVSQFNVQVAKINSDGMPLSSAKERSTVATASEEPAENTPTASVESSSQSSPTPPLASQAAPAAAAEKVKGSKKKAQAAKRASPVEATSHTVKPAESAGSGADGVQRKVPVEVKNGGANGGWNGGVRIQAGNISAVLEETQRILQKQIEEHQQELRELRDEIKQATQQNNGDASAQTRILQTISTTVNKQVPDAVQRAISQALPQAMNKYLDQQLPGVINAAVQSNLPAAVQQPVREAVRTAFERQVLPALEAATRQMFADVTHTLQSGVQEHIQHVLSQGSLSSATVDIKAELQGLIDSSKYEDAFNRALSEGDLELLTWFLGLLSPETVLTDGERHLSSAVILSLCQQLAFDLYTETALKLEWLQDACLALETVDATIAAHATHVLQEVFNNLEATLQSGKCPGHNFKVVMHIVKSLILSSRAAV